MAIGIFKPGGKGSQVVDCARSTILGFRCSMTKDIDYAPVTVDLKKMKSDTTCIVSATRLVGKTEKGTTYVEVACTDKLKGYLLEYQAQPVLTVVNAVGCSLAGNCKLPGNV